MKNNVLAGALIALGLCLGGMFIYLGFNTFANKDRGVTVKGLSTRDYLRKKIWPRLPSLSFLDIG